MKAILIDDSKQARELLGLMINELAPEVKIAAEAESVDEAIIEIREYRPELIFLDIEMPGKSGLQLVDQLSKEELNFEIIFTTAYNQYALQAFRLSAIDYLLKPIREKELVDAISKAKQRIEASRSKERLSVLVNNLSIENQDILCIPLNYGYEFVPLNEIEYIEADGAYSHIYQVVGKKITVSKNLKFFQDRLEALSSFVKVHRSCIVNLNYMQSFFKNERGIILLKSGVKVALSRSCRQDFLNALEQLKK